ncbi:MAG: RHS repeat-associated core domain-containing protein [Polyangia bacterium]
MALADSASPEAQLDYLTDGLASEVPNLTFSKPGSLSLWVKPGAQYLSTALMVAFDAAFKLVIVDDGGSVTADLERQDDGGNTHLWPATAGPPNWRTDGRWHLVVVNWTAQAINVSIDGVSSPVLTAPWLSARPVGVKHNSLIYAGVPWPTAAADYLKDELLILNRPLTNDDIQWYLGQAATSGSVNPAIAHFGADATVCDATDDLNPCTADACSPASGVTHINVAQGTSCGASQTCNATGSCESLACPPSPDACKGAGTRDLATGACQYAPVANGASCDDGNRCTVNDVCLAGVCNPGAATGCAGTTYFAPVTDLGTFGENPGASAINEAGDVVGSGWFPAPPGGPRPHAFRYSAATGVKAVFPDDTWSYGWDINDNGIAVGAIAAGGNAFWQGAAGAPTLFTEPGTSANANAINSSNEMVGWVLPNTGIPKAFRYSTALGMNANLGTLVGPQFNGGTDARAIDDLGRIVGLAGYLPVSGRNWWDQGHAFVIPRGGAIQDLNTLKAGSSTFATLSAATATNGTLIAGWGFRANGEIHGYRYHEGGTTEEIGGLPAKGCAYSAAYGINAQGDVVGTAFPAPEGGVSRAILYTSTGQLYDLNDFVDPNSGWVLSEARDINNTNHEVVGFGTHGTLGMRAFKMKVPDLSPCPASTNLCQQASGTRDPITGLCSLSNIADGTACNDGNASTILDTCRSGTCWGSVAPYQGTPTFASLTDLGVYDGVNSAMATGINSNGDVAGIEVGTTRNWIWRYTAANTLSSLIPTLPSDEPVKFWETTGINDSGTVVGDTGWHGEGFSAPIGQAAQIVTARRGYGSANAINSAGQIAGQEPASDTAGSYLAAYRRDSDGSKHYVERLLGATRSGGTLNGYSTAVGISTAGELVGFADLVELSRTFDTGFTFAPGWGMREAYIFSDPYTGAASQHNLNDYAAANQWQLLYVAQATSGTRTVGWGVKDNRCRAFRYTTGTNSIIDLGTLEATHAGSDVCQDSTNHTNYYAPSSINSVGEIVGNIAYGGAFYYSDALGKMIDLQSIIDPALNVTVLTAAAINEQHEVAGTMAFAGSPKTHAYKMKLPGWTLSPVGDAWSKITPRVDGIVDVGGGQYAVVFGYENANPSDVQLLVADRQNSLARNGITSTNESVSPPTTIVVGKHLGAFLPRGVAGETLTWTLAGKEKSMTIAPSVTPPLAHVTTPGVNGYGVNIPNESGQDQLVMIESDVSQYLVPPDPKGFAQDPQEEQWNFNGTLTGKLGVSPTGAATYTVPIAIPPGIAGMAPNLSLVYNSQGGDGIAGQGWELSGLSSIYRCPLTRMKDGFNRPLTMGDQYWAQVDENGGDDGFCLDGRRLYRQRSFDTSDGWGYEAEQRDFSRIVRHFGQAYEYFTVATKGGEVRYYGQRANSIVTFPSHDGLPGNASVAAVWPLDRVVDGWGNYYVVHYNNDGLDFGARGLIVTDIDYTGHLASTAGTSGSGAGGQVDPFYSIHFQYDPLTRPDVRQVRFRDSILSKKSRLSAIVTPGGTYALTYKAPDPMLPSRLEQIKFCSAGQCAEPLVFGWDAGGYRWDSTSAEAVAYQSPIAIDGPTAGVQFVDLDGDGRVEMVESRSDSTGTRSDVWKHNGSAWVTNRLWQMEQRLADPDGKRHGFLADMDGDGLLDVVADEVADGGGLDGPSKELRVSTNQSRNPETQSMWSHSNSQILPSNMQYPSFSGSRLPGYIDTIADMNGDGRADFVRLNYNEDRMHVALYSGAGWVEDVKYARYPIDQNMALRDINRDGLPDLVWPDKAYLNKGKPPDDRDYFHYVIGGGFVPPVTLGTEGERLGDVDGDGMFDSVSYVEGASLAPGDPGYRGAIGFSTGMGYVAGGMTGYDQAFIDSSPTYERWLNANPRPVIHQQDYAFALLDINADGLVDLVRHHYDGGQAFINTGSSWQVIGGPVAWSYYMSPGTDPVPGLRPIEWTGQGPGTFVDLDGDGVTDVIQASKFGMEVRSKVYLNKFRPPVINSFPNGLAGPTTVSFAVITTAAAREGAAPTYFDSAAKPASAAYLSVPLRVVASVSADNGLGEMLATTYRYSNLRADSYGRGPQGFRDMTVTEPADGANPGMQTVTTFAQVYPYTGLPTSVVRYQQGLVTSTKTTYCDTPTVTNGGAVACTDQTEGYGSSFTAKEVLFVYPRYVVDTSYLRTGSVPEAVSRETITTTTHFQYDDVGNPTHTTVTSTKLDSSTHIEETYQNETENVYDASVVGDLGVRLGKMTSSTVTAQRLVPADSNVPPRVHHASFAYGNAIGVTEWGAVFGGQPLAMIKKVDEPNAGVGLELDTAYEYDRFGDVVTTTTCANDFNNCTPGAVSGSEPQFRTTRVSYDPTSFVGNSGGVAGPLSYKAGRFPVRTTNAAGHNEYTAYDPVSGNLRQQTGPNGVTTMFYYDFLGRLSSQTERVGTNKAAKTFIDRLWVPGGAVANAVVVTVKRTPTDGDIWTYADKLGREVLTAKRGFGGQFVRVTTEYDRLGRVRRVSSPYPDGQTAAFWTTNSYADPLGRPTTTTRDLAQIDDSGNNASVLVRTTYNGSEVFTDHILPCSNCVSPEGEIHRRVEKKNALGKVAVAEVDGYSTIPLTTQSTYKYDADGNLTHVIDSAGHDVASAYDIRGRKTSATDPDLGTRTYTYDGFGQLLTERDGQLNTTTMTYDILGRMKTRKDPDGNMTEWLFDTAAGAGRGKIAAMIGPSSSSLKDCALPSGATVTGGNRAVRSFKYSQSGQVEEVSECTDGDTFLIGYEYDKFDRQSVVRYPAVNGARFAAKYNYASTGHLHYVSDPADGTVYWAAQETNVLGQVTREYTRNGVETVKTRNPVTGWLRGSSSTAQADGDRLIQEWSYTYDVVGDLTGRTRSDALHTTTMTEEFTYDPLERLKTSRVRTLAGIDGSESYSYDNLGNLTAKAGKTYSYSGCQAGPHAVCAVDGSAFTYDAHGNMISGGGRSVSYDWHDKSTHIAGPNGSTDFVYGADGNRVLQETTDGSVGGAQRTIYVGLGGTGRSLYERTKSSGVTEHTHFVYAGGAHDGGPFALRIVKTADAGTTSVSSRYFHTDHLGSVVAMSDETGHVLDAGWGANGSETMGYDAWGARRGPNAEALPAATAPLPGGHRGFTGHEFVPNVGLVNMNGRMYDPALGRFLSADPTVQMPTDPANYNRYSYVQNNPLRYTDPTGYAFFGMSGPTLFATVFYVGACAISAGAGCVAAGIAFAFYGAMSAVTSGASLDQVVATGVVSFAAGQFGGAVAGAIVGSGAGVVGQLVGGAIAGAVSAAVTTAVYGGNLGTNMAHGALMGAMWAGVSAGLNRAAAVTQASDPAAQGGGGLMALKRAAGYGSGDDASLTADLREHPLFSGSGDDRRLSGYWRSKLQPFFEGRGLDLADVQIRLEEMDAGTLGEVRYRSDPKTVFLNRDLATVRGVETIALDTVLHESMHLVEGNQIGGWGSFVRTVSDKFRFGFSDDAQYQWKNYGDLRGASYSWISATGGTSYPVEAGFDRFSASVMGNLSRCGGVCQ